MTKRYMYLSYIPKETDEFELNVPVFVEYKFTKKNLRQSCRIYCCILVTFGIVKENIKQIIIIQYVALNEQILYICIYTRFAHIYLKKIYMI